MPMWTTCSASQAPSDMERIPAVDSNGDQIYDCKGRKAYVWSYHMPNFKSYPFRILEWISQGINVFGGGHQDLTFSQRAGAWDYHGEIRWPARIIDAVFGKDHCRKAWKHKI